jgi:hypothetical protein
MRFEKSNGEWTLKAPIEGRAEFSAVDGLVSRIGSLQMKSLLSTPPPQGDGLQKPAATLRIGTGSSQATLLLGASAGEGSVYARDAARPAIFTVDASLLDDLKKAYQEKATITELAKDDKRGQGYRLGAPAKQVALAISDDLVALVGKQSEASVTDAIKQIPDKTFSVDVWVKDEELTGVALDLTQFFDKPVSGHKLALDVGIDLNSGKVSAPSGATEINIDKLLEQFPAGALGGGLGGPAVGSDFDPGTGLGDSDAGIGDPDTNVGGSGTELTDAQIEMLKQSGMTKKQIKQLMDAQSGK